MKPSDKTPPPRARSQSDVDVEAPELGEVLEFMRLLWGVDHGLQSISKRMEATLGVTGPQRLAIRLIGHYPKISAGELAGILSVHPSTLTGVLQRLGERGMVQRTADPSDARRAVLELTPKGKKIDELRTGTVEAAIRTALDGLPPRKVQAAREVLAEVIASLKVKEE